MPNEVSAGKPTTRRHSEQEKAAAVRIVRSLRAELRTTQNIVHRVSTQPGYGVESVRARGLAPGGHVVASDILQGHGSQGRGVDGERAIFR